jgi:hypothetical protein
LDSHFGIREQKMTEKENTVKKGEEPEEIEGFGFI